MEQNETSGWISAVDVANYVVCPEAWRLKLGGHSPRVESARSAKSQEQRARWIEEQDLSQDLRKYSKVAYVLLLLLTILVFVFESRRSEYVQGLLSRAALKGGPLAEFRIPAEIVSLLLVLGLLIFMWDLFERRSQKLQAASGLNENTRTIAAKGSSSLPESIYFSKSLGLRSKPTAIVKEGGKTVPVDIHPVANKIRDRHIVQLLTHLRLIEEAEGVRPEYGILLMGKAQRRVLVKNTPEKQRWLGSIVDEMRSILDGVPAVACPAPLKCKTCDVRNICSFSAWKSNSSGQELVKIGRA